MAWTMLLPLAASVAMLVGGTSLGRRLPPATAVRLMTATMLATALATGFVLAVAAFTVLAQLPTIAALGRWSVEALRTGDPISVSAGVAAGVTVIALLTAAIQRALTSGRDLIRSVVLCRRLGPAAAGLVVVADDTPDAYAIPGLSGRIVISTAMLQALPAAERAVLLAHETAHLEKHHHAYLLIAGLAAAANPMLRPSAYVVRHAIERWADEIAAGEVGDRALAARALVRAGLARGAARRPDLSVALGGTDASVPNRARALLAAPPAPRPLLAAALAVLMLVVVSASAVTARDTEARFETAQKAYSAWR